MRYIREVYLFLSKHKNFDMHLVFFDDCQIRNQLKPLTLTRPIADLRIGIRTIREKWLFFSKSTCGDVTESYLEPKFPKLFSTNQNYINSTVLPNESVWLAVQNLKQNQKLVAKGVVIAINTNDELGFDESFDKYHEISFENEIEQISALPDMFLKNANQISYDFIQITEGRISQKIDDEFSNVYAPENVFIEEGASITSTI